MEREMAAQLNGSRAHGGPPHMREREMQTEFARWNPFARSPRGAGLALLLLGAAFSWASAEGLGGVIRETMRDRELRPGEARSLLREARQDGVSATERRELQGLVDKWGDRFDPRAADVIKRAAPKNSVGDIQDRLRGAAAAGGVSAGEAEAIIGRLKKDAATAAERRGLVRETAVLSKTLSSGARDVFDRFRSTPDKVTANPFNQMLPGRPGDAGNRLINRKTKSIDYAVLPRPAGREARLYDGSGNARGRLLAKAVHINFGQRKLLRGKPHVYVIAAKIRTSRGKTTVSGWIPETALEHGLLRHMPTIDAPKPLHGDLPGVYTVTGGSKELNERLENAHIKVNPRIPARKRVAATDYLLRGGGWVNLCYNLPRRGGVAADTFPVGVKFIRSKGIPLTRIPLYKPDSERRAGSMAFVYGHVGDRYGWIARQAIRRDP